MARRRFGRRRRRPRRGGLTEPDGDGAATAAMPGKPAMRRRRLTPARGSPRPMSNPDKASGRLLRRGGRCRRQRLGCRLGRRRRQCRQCIGRRQRQPSRATGLGNSYGVLVQSIGGIGGNGGHSGAWFNPQGGNGDQGGTAGTATITGTGANIQTGVRRISATRCPERDCRDRPVDWRWRWRRRQLEGWLDGHRWSRRKRVTGQHRKRRVDGFDRHHQ